MPFDTYQKEISNIADKYREKAHSKARDVIETFKTELSTTDDYIAALNSYLESCRMKFSELIAYINAYYGFESEIIDHKAWRSGNSDASKEFAKYLANYQDHRTHD